MSVEQINVFVKGKRKCSINLLGWNWNDRLTDQPTAYTQSSSFMRHSYNCMQRWQCAETIGMHLRSTRIMHNLRNTFAVMMLFCMAIIYVIWTSSGKLWNIFFSFSFCLTLLLLSTSHSVSALRCLRRWSGKFSNRSKQFFRSFQLECVDCRHVSHNSLLINL